jgi:hypothetical protein
MQTTTSQTVIQDLRGIKIGSIAAKQGNTNYRLLGTEHHKINFRCCNGVCRNNCLVTFFASQFLFRVANELLTSFFAGQQFEN